MIKSINTLTAYNLWANKKIAHWLLSNEPEKLIAICKSSFSTVERTVNHMWDAQNFYLSILRQIPFDKNWDGTSKSAISGLVEQSKDFMEYTARLDIIELTEVRTVETKTLSGTFDQYQLIQHCMNHSTFHRGQIITMGHQLELTKAPSTDLFNYLNESPRM